MTNDGTSRSGFSAVSRALLASVADLAKEFPDVPLPTLYEAVGDARPTAVTVLPDLVAYRLAITDEARRRVEGAARVIVLPDVAEHRLGALD